MELIPDHGWSNPRRPLADGIEIIIGDVPVDVNAVPGCLDVLFDEFQAFSMDLIVSRHAGEWLAPMKLLDMLGEDGNDVAQGILLAGRCGRLALPSGKIPVSPGKLPENPRIGAGPENPRIGLGPGWGSAGRLGTIRLWRADGSQRAGRVAWGRRRAGNRRRP